MEEDKLKEDARNLCGEIREIIKCLDQTHRNVNIANTIGSSASVIGGVAFGTGALFAVPTLAGIGAAAAGVGSVVNVGSNATEHFITKEYVSDVQKKWEELQNKLAAFFMEKLGSEDNVRTIFKIIKDIIEGIISLNTGWDLIRNRCLQTENPLQTALRNPTVENTMGSTRFAAGGCRVANAMSVERGAVNAATGLNRAYQGVKMVGMGAFVLNAVLLPLNVYELYNAASGAISGEPSEASAKLGRIAEFLDAFATGRLRFDVHMTICKKKE